MTNTTDPPTAWFVEFSLTNGEADMNITTIDGTTYSLLLRGLHPGSEYRVRVTGVNTRGAGELSAYATNTSELIILVYLHIPIHMIPYRICMHLLAQTQSGVGAGVVAIIATVVIILLLIICGIGILMMLLIR